MAIGPQAIKFVGTLPLSLANEFTKPLLNS
jgi:hypothetical protein